MSFSTDLAKLVTDQIARFVTLNRYQLAGHIANLDFWLGQVRHALEALDGYGKRFQRQSAAQAKHVEEHQTVVFELSDPCCTQGKAWPPQRVPDREMRDARQALCDATRRFLVRCGKERFLEKPLIRQICGELGIGVEAADLRFRT